MTQQFGQLTASELYCPKCKVAQPVRERLLLVLPTGELHEFLCRQCGTSVGKRTVTGPAVSPLPRRSGGARVEARRRARGLLR